MIQRSLEVQVCWPRMRSSLGFAVKNISRACIFTCCIGPLCWNAVFSNGTCIFTVKHRTCCRFCIQVTSLLTDEAFESTIKFQMWINFTQHYASSVLLLFSNIIIFTLSISNKQTFSNRILYFNKDVGLTMHNVTWNRFPIKNLLIDSNSCLETSYLNAEICKFESWQKMKAEPIWLIPRKLTANETLLIVFVSLQYKIFYLF